MKIGFHSPMPPARTGVADYSAALARALGEAGHELAINPARPGVAEVDLYHLGNNPLHRPMQDRALAHPGAVLLHDAVLHHYYLGLGDERRYLDEFVHNYGEWHRGLGEELWRHRGRSGSDPAYFAYPMLRRVAETARLVLVHNRAAAAMVRRHAPTAAVEEIPHLVEPPPPADVHAVLELRERWRIPAGGYVLGVFGHLREAKRVHSALAAVDRVPHAYLVVAGDFVSEDYARTLEPVLSAHPRVRRSPFLAETGFWTHAHAVDACINLRFPAAGETSGISMRLMSAGKPVLVTSGEETAGLPATACLRVDAGPAETEMLAAYIAWLSQFPQSGRAIGEAGRHHVQIEHEAARVAGRLGFLLRGVQKPGPLR